MAHNEIFVKQNDSKVENFMLVYGATPIGQLHFCSIFCDWKLNSNAIFL